MRGERKFFNVVVTSYEGVLKEKNFLEKVRGIHSHQDWGRWRGGTQPACILM